MPEGQKFPDKSKLIQSWSEQEFVAHPLLANSHLMTIVPGFLPRKFAQFRQSGKPRWFDLDGHNKVLGYLHSQDDKSRTTLILLHGLEGSSQSSHVLGIGHKAFMNGFNVLRLNMRNCGGTMLQARSLYNAGMWHDLRDVMQSLQKEEGFENFILAGYSLGGNLLLNTVAQHDPNSNYQIKAACTVSPSIDLAHAVEAIERPQNRLYQDWFLRTMKAMLLAKAKQHPDIYDPAPLKNIATIREFDDRFTAPQGGYGTAARYYQEASAVNCLHKIKIPTLIITAEDDPLVPIATFRRIEKSYEQIDMLIVKHGGHGGFYQKEKELKEYFDHYWAENRVVDYIMEVNRI